MDWLVIIIVVISGLIGLIQKAAKEMGGSVARGPIRPPEPGRMPRPPRLPGETAVPGEGEGSSLEGVESAWSEGEGASEEGSTLEGYAEGTAPLAPEVLQEQAELARDRVEFRAEAARLTSDEEAAKPAPVPEDFALDWEETWSLDGEQIVRETPAEYSPIGRGWLSKREELVRAVLAAEILNRPGGWRARRRLARTPR